MILASTEPAPPPRYLRTILAITLLAAIPRFLCLNIPTVSADELATFSQFSPIWLRLAPALAGTLLVPTSYLLARQLLPARAAIVAALFVACSASLMFDSRHATPHIFVCLAITFSMAALLLSFGNAWFLFALIPALVATALFALLIRPIPAPNAVPLNAAITQLLGFHPTTDPSAPYLARELMTWSLRALLLIILICIIPWPRRSIVAGRRWIVWNLAVSPTLRAPIVSSNPQRLPRPFWQVALILILWISVPAYALYAAADPATALTPFDAALAIVQHAKSHLPTTLQLAALLAILFIIWTRRVYPFTRAEFEHRYLPWILVMGFLFFACLLMQVIALLFARFHGTFGWQDRNLIIIAPPLFVALAGVLYRLRWPRLRRPCIVVILTINFVHLATFIRLNRSPRVDLIAGDVIAAANSPRSIRTYVRLPKDSVLFSPVGRYYLNLLSPTKRVTIDQIRRAPSDRYAFGDARYLLPSGHLILWDDLSPEPRNSLPANTSDWTLAGENVYPIYDSTTWRHLGSLRRRDFIRDAARSSARTPAPAHE